MATGSWKELQPTTTIKLDDDPRVREVMLRSGLSESAVDAALAEHDAAPSFGNDEYIVTVIRKPIEVEGRPTESVHLHVRRRDGAPARNWRDLQWIKNELIGPECEAIELYPAESRLVDTANVYHLWGVADPQFRFPVGFAVRSVT